MKIDNVQCTKCGGNDFRTFCKTCKDLESHDDAIRRECARAADICLENQGFKGGGKYTLREFMHTAIMNAGK